MTVAAPVVFCTRIKFAAYGASNFAADTKLGRLKPMRALLILAKVDGMLKSAGCE